MRNAVSFVFADVFTVALLVREIICCTAGPRLQCRCVYFWSALKGLISELKLPRTHYLKLSLSVCIIWLWYPFRPRCLLFRGESACQWKQLLVCIYVGLWSLLCCQIDRNGWKKVRYALIHTDTLECFVDHTFKKIDRLLRCCLIFSVCVCESVQDHMHVVPWLSGVLCSVESPDYF